MTAEHTRLVQWSGVQAAATSVRSSGPYMRVEFATNGTDDGPGFNVRYHSVASSRGADTSKYHFSVLFPHFAA